MSSAEKPSRTLVVGDMHTRQALILPRVDGAIHKYGVNRVVFLGDYTDEWSATATSILEALEFQLEWAKKNKEFDITFLVGNHDFQYLIGRENAGTHPEIFTEASALLKKFDLKVACVIDGMLATHGGLTQAWANRYLRDASGVNDIAEKLNAMLWLFRGRNALALAGSMRGGWDDPSPIWADKLEVVANPADGFGQIIGHTPVKSCINVQELYSKDDKPWPIWCCDTFSASKQGTASGDGSMLLVSDNEINVIAKETDSELEPWSSVSKARRP